MHIGRYNRRYIVGLITRVSLAKKGTNSMKTTIPEGIVEFLQLSDKDELEWRMEIQDQRRVATLKKKSIDSVSSAAKTAIRYTKHRISGKN